MQNSKLAIAAPECFREMVEFTSRAVAKKFIFWVGLSVILAGGTKLVAGAIKAGRIAQKAVLGGKVIKLS